MLINFFKKNMPYLKNNIFLGLSLSIFIPNAFSDQWNIVIDNGVAWPHFKSSTTDILVDPDVINQYTVKTPPQSKWFYGIGISDQFEYANTSLSLGLSTYFMKTDVAGVNTPFINAGNFDTLNYTVQGRARAFFLEPKITWKKTLLQPYFIGGLGVAYNHFGSYTEVPSAEDSTAVPTLDPFNNRTKSNFAYEFGAGVQYPIICMNKITPVLALDYRMMNFGTAQLAPAAGQTSSQTLSFGHLRSNAVNLNLIVPIS